MFRMSVILSLFLSSASALAADSSSGCGAGWYLFKENSLVSSTLRGTTNALFFNNTFGMTFGTSNCSKHSIVQNEKEQIYYSEANREQLAIEMAQGSGEYVETYARVMGCSEDVIPEFVNTARRQYSEIMPSSATSAGEMLQNVKKQIRSNFSLALACNA